MGAHDPRSAQDRSTVHNLCSPVNIYPAQFLFPGIGSGIVQYVGRILRRLLNTLLLLTLPLGLCLAILGAQLLSPKRLNFVDLSPKTWGVGIGLSVAQVTTW